MALSPREEQAFSALITDLERVKGTHRRAIAWAVLIIACLGAIVAGGALGIPWLSTIGWLGLIAAGLAGVAVPTPRG